MLATRAARIARADRRTRDYTLNALRHALAEVVAALPGLPHLRRRQAPRHEDRRYIDWAIAARAAAQPRRRHERVRLRARRVLLGDAAGATPAPRASAARFARSFQQFTAPVMAKGIEDTAFYRYNRLVVAERGRRRPATVRHARSRRSTRASADRARHWPHTMLATSTHDNKRSEDVRARIDVLSEMPAAWRLTLRRWARINRRHAAARRRRAGAHAQRRIPAVPDAARQPARRAARRRRRSTTTRAHRRRYMLKAAREAKRRTSWISPQRRLRGGAAAFVDGLLARREPIPSSTTCSRP